MQSVTRFEKVHFVLLIFAILPVEGFYFIVCQKRIKFDLAWSVKETKGEKYDYLILRARFHP